MNARRPLPIRECGGNWGCSGPPRALVAGKDAAWPESAGRGGMKMGSRHPGAPAPRRSGGHRPGHTQPPEARNPPPPPKQPCEPKFYSRRGRRHRREAAGTHHVCSRLRRTNRWSQAPSTTARLLSTCDKVRPHSEDPGSPTTRNSSRRVARWGMAGRSAKPSAARSERKTAKASRPRLCRDCPRLLRRMWPYVLEIFAPPMTGGRTRRPVNSPVPKTLTNFTGDHQVVRWTKQRF